MHCNVCQRDHHSSKWTFTAHGLGTLLTFAQIVLEGISGISALKLRDFLLF